MIYRTSTDCLKARSLHKIKLQSKMNRYKKNLHRWPSSSQQTCHCSEKVWTKNLNLLLNVGKCTKQYPQELIHYILTADDGYPQ